MRKQKQIPTATLVDYPMPKGGIPGADKVVSKQNDKSVTVRMERISNWIKHFILFFRSLLSADIRIQEEIICVD